MKTAMSLAALSALSCLAETPPAKDLNRFTASARLTFNVKVGFSDGGGLPPSSLAGPAVGNGVNRDYDDGYVRIDSEGNAGGLTWNWGYRDASQIAGDDTLRLHSSSAPSSSYDASPDEPVPGFEVAWLRDLYAGERWAVGVKVAFGYGSLGLNDNAPVLSPVLRTTDTYSLGGIIPPGDPSLPGWQYQGTAGGPGPLIGDQPLNRTVTTVPNGALTTGERQFDADLFHWKLGPWWEGLLFPRCALHLGGGLGWSVVSSEYRFNEVTTVAGVGSFSHQGRGGATDVTVGGYVEAQLHFKVTDRSAIILGAEFQSLQSVQQNLGGRRVELDIGTAWSLQAGFSFSF
jgi:hypothetical protein